MVYMDLSTHNLSPKELSVYRFIRNQLVHFNHAPSVREVMKHINASSPRSADLLINSLIEKGLLKRRNDDSKLQLTDDILRSDDSVSTVSLPLVGRVAAGIPILAEENIEAHIPVDIRLLRGNPKDHYLLRVHGNSMNLRGINNGDLAIIKVQPSADPGQNVVALINDEATVKEFIPVDGTVILKPHSTDKSIQPIILQEDFMIRGVVVGTVATSSL